MWSDRPSTAKRLEIIASLRRVLPVPRADAMAVQMAAPTPPDIPSQPGLVWLDRPQDEHLFLDPIAQLAVRNGVASVTGPCGQVEIEARGFDLIEAALAAWGPAPGARLCGYLGYELGLELEEIAPPQSGTESLPDLWLGLYDSWFKHSSSGWSLHHTNAWRTVDQAASGVTSHPVEAGPMVHPMRHPNPDAFIGAVARTVERIHNGELFQVNLCQRWEAPLPASQILPLYRKLRSISPASQGAFLRIGADSAVLSVSPELFLAMEHGLVRSHPIKGTRPRGQTPAEDAALLAALTASEKDRAELAMIVDVARNDLGRVCRPGSIAVTHHAEPVTLPTVHHTFSEVVGRLRAEYGPAGLLRASFPPASISGAPKIRAMEIAVLEEGLRRGPAMGSIGWISLEGDMELSVAIRTAAASGGKVWYLAGCGITAESVPADELAESEAKAAAFLRAFQQLREN